MCVAVVVAAAVAAASGVLVGVGRYHHTWVLQVGVDMLWLSFGAAPFPLVLLPFSPASLEGKSADTTRILEENRECGLFLVIRLV